MENLFLLHLVLNKRSTCWLLAAGWRLPGPRPGAASICEAAGRAGLGLAAVWRAARLPGLSGRLGDLSLISPLSLAALISAHVHVLMALCLSPLLGLPPRRKSSDYHKGGLSASSGIRKKSYCPHSSQRKQETRRPGCGQSSCWSSGPRFPAAPGAAGRRGWKSLLWKQGVGPTRSLSPSGTSTQGR